MDLLLDTHAFLWSSLDDPALSAVARAAIVDSGNRVFLSVASLWEIAIKVNLGKLRLRVSFDELIKEIYLQQGVGVLDIRAEHLIRLAQLPRLHRDPFDRLIVAQALAEGFAVVGNDSSFDAYGVKRVW